MSSKELGSLKDVFEQNGGHWQSFIMWVKNRFTLSRADYQNMYEPILYGWREGVVNHYFIDRRDKANVWKYDKPNKSELHPTMKPVALVSEAIINSSQQGEIVLDTFLGSGSTLIASEKTNRICYGMELDPRYVDVIVQRYVDYTGNNKIKKNGVEIEWK